MLSSRSVAAYESCRQSIRLPWSKAQDFAHGKCFVEGLTLLVHKVTLYMQKARPAISELALFTAFPFRFPP